MAGSKADIARIREALDQLVDLSGLSRREIERRLTHLGSGFNVSRLLAGRFEIKLRQMLEVLRVLEVHPVEFFRLVFKEPQARSPLLARVEALFASGKPLAQRHPGPAERDLDELRRRLEAMEKRFEQLRVKPR